MIAILIKWYQILREFPFYVHLAIEGPSTVTDEFPLFTVSEEVKSILLKP